MQKINIGDVIALKKQHPCGSYEWTVIRTGADIKLQCVKCERIIMLDRPTVVKKMRAIRRAGANNGENN
jgi:hypothetical protein